MSFFAYPWLLTLLLPVILLSIYYCFFKPQPGLLAAETAGFAAGKKFWSWKTAPVAAIMTVTALILLTIALARPRLGNEKFIVRSKGIDMIMVLDLSGSMQAVDVPQSITRSAELEQALKSGKLKTRLESAKSELTKFIQNRPNDRIGLIGFAEFGYNFSPPTLDHNWLIAALQPLEPGIIGDATGIAGATASAIRRLDKSTAPRRVMVLFTDGKNNVNHRLTPLATAELAKEKNILIYTVGIGGDNAFILQNDIFGKRYVRYPGEFDEKLLQDMANATGGKYFRANDEEALNEVMQEINTLEKTNIEQPRYIEYQEYAPLLAAIALILLILSVISKNTFERSIP